MLELNYGELIVKLKEELIDEEVHALGLYGSWNYGLANEDSDIDCVAVVDGDLTKRYWLHLEDIDCKVISMERFKQDLVNSGYVIFNELLDCKSMFYIDGLYKNEIEDHLEDYLYVNPEKFTACIKHEWYKGYNHVKFGKKLPELSKHKVIEERYGYSTKLVAQSFRMFHLFKRFDEGKRGKQLYRATIEERKFLEDVKNAKYAKKDLIKMLDSDKIELNKIRAKYK